MTTPNFKIIELFFFAYRDFTKDADIVLANYNFGRAHHRVIHFVYRNEGLSVNEVLDILKITRQSLSRVLKELIEKEFIVQRLDEKDRRLKHLYLTPSGIELAQRLSLMQSQRIDKALTETQCDEKMLGNFFKSMINEEDKTQIERLLK